MKEERVANGLARVLRYWNHSLFYADDAGEGRIKEAVTFPDAGIAPLRQGRSAAPGQRRGVPGQRGEEQVMPKIVYTPKRFGPATLALVASASTIVEEYARQGYDLTLRQLYYQFVARGLLPNKQSEYKRLGGIINDARLAGLIDWDHITDRTRNLSSLPHWTGPDEIVQACAAQFRLDKWSGQPVYVEVWIEKEALAGVFQRVCQRWDVPWFSCRGYTSQSEMWAAARRMISLAGDRQAIVLHFGDHDPSGIDMTRDIRERLNLFQARVEVRRLALNMDQVQAYNPPPNPAKQTDSRFAGYLDQYGDESWELDALEPSALAGLVEQALADVMDTAAWQRAVTQEQECRRLLGECSHRWAEVARML